MSGTPGMMKFDALPAKLLRWLQGSTKWYSTGALTQIFIGKPDSIRAALHRLRAKGLIESRTKGREVEWRATEREA